METSQEKTKVFSEILRDIGQVIFAAMVIGPIVSGAINFSSALFGLLFSFLAWYSSVSIIKE